MLANHNTAQLPSMTQAQARMVSHLRRRFSVMGYETRVHEDYGTCLIVKTTRGDKTILANGEELAGHR